MSIEFGIWRIDDGVKKVSSEGMDFENRLQEILVEDISIVDDNLLVIGQKVKTDLGKEIDVLCMDSAGSLVVLELKRDKTPRTVVAQILEYASWVYNLKPERIQQIYTAYQVGVANTVAPRGVNDALRQRFGNEPAELNASHRLVIVASEIDPAIEMVVEYLDEVYGLKIEVALFRAFQDSGRQYVTRAWVGGDSIRTEDHQVRSREHRDWNDEWYVVFAGAAHRIWADAVQYGFYSAGGGKLFADAIKRLGPGDRIWVYVSGYGYVGVGTVTTEPTSQDEFVIDYQGQATPIQDLVDLDPWFSQSVENAEFFVGVDWAKTVELADGISEPGFFSNPNTVAQPSSDKWRFTVEFLKRAWTVD